MSELAEKVKKSIQRLKLFEPDDGYYLAFSGGKDSVVCKALLDEAGVKYDSTYRVTSVDPPELVQFIKDKHPDVVREIPHYKDGSPITMWNLIVKKLYPPTRIARYCCAELKETGGGGRIVVTGVRWAESNRRRTNHGIVDVKTSSQKIRAEAADNGFVEQGISTSLRYDNEDAKQFVDQCYQKKRTTLNPIIDWTDEEVWEYIRAHGIPYCSLYDEGKKRLGCIGCPMAGYKQRCADFERWPKYKELYIRAFDKMLKRREEIGRPFLIELSGGGVFLRWLEANGK